PEGAQVVIDTTGTIDGNVEFDLWGSNVEGEVKSNLTVKNGTFTGKFKVDKSVFSDANINIAGGTFANPVEEGYCAEGYIPKANEDGTYGVKEGRYVAQVGDRKYESFDEAIAAVPADGTETTVKLLVSQKGNGFRIHKGQNLVLDFNKNVYTIDKRATVSGKAVNGFFVEDGGELTLKNGTLEAETAKTLVQNCGKLNVEDMNLDGTKNDAVYVISSDNGKVSVHGATSITAAEGGYALDLGWAPKVYAAGTQVEVDTTGTITGKVALDQWGAATTGTPKTTLTIKNGHFDGVFEVDEDTFKNDKNGNNPCINISGGTFADSVPQAYCERYYTPVDQEADGKTEHTVARINAVFKGVALEMKGSIVMDFLLDLPENVLKDKDAYVLFTINGQETKVPVAEAESDGTTYVFTKDVKAYMLHDNVELRIYANGELVEIYNGNNKIEAYTDSIDAYCKRALKTLKDDKTKNFIRAIANYGNAVAVSANHDAGVAKVDEAQFEGITQDSFKPYKPVFNTKATGIRYQGSSLTVRQDTSILFTFLLDRGAKAEDYTFTLNGKEVTPVVDGSYVDISTEGLSSRMLADVHELEIVNKNDNTKTVIKYSAMSYAYNIMSVKNQSKTLTNIAKALYNYNKYSQEYFAE
ncbi:MAG: hypothetical protein K5744_10860, partial [Eubacterium sp.]|nr:hypothetical protein [Eubacterium sp.]